jgi:putative endonuclease
MRREKMNKNDEGEALALEYFKENKYKILHKNFTSRLGEIDLIVQKKDVIVFVEVKSRSKKDYGYGREFVTNKKIWKICKTADFFRCKFPNENVYYRFDVVEVDLKLRKIEHFENAFEYCL